MNLEREQNWKKKSNCQQCAGLKNPKIMSLDSYCIIIITDVLNSGSTVVVSGKG